MSEFVVVIPARYASTRLPGKPLQDINGKPMVQWVYEQALKSNASQVIIATDDARIEQVAQGFDANVCMTREDHESGTDRLQEVADKMGFAPDAIVVNVQGDEPLIPPAVINQVAALLAENPDADVATLCEPLTELNKVLDPNVVKVVSSKESKALYFSRAPIPWARDEFGSQPKALPTNANYQRHIGIYAYRTGLLHRFVKWPPTPLETLEKLEQLRAMENGAVIMVAPACEEVPGGVDTQADLDTVRQLVNT
jgi:3-deoxy-manno-octulosonate cytidylyltransferase (CMP-KDO synthetase)